MKSFEQTAAADDSKENDHMNEKIREFTKLLPKVELHAHLNGCIRESTLLDLIRQQNVPITPELMDLLKADFDSTQIDSSGCAHRGFGKHKRFNASFEEDSSVYNHKRRSLTECFQIFPLIHQCVCTLPLLERITREALDDFSAENVCYLELRTTPRMLCDPKSSKINHHHKNEKTPKDCLATKEDYINVILNVFNEFQEREWKRFHQECTTNQHEYVQSKAEVSNRRYNEEKPPKHPRLPLIPRLLISIDRSGTVEEAIENIELATRIFQRGNEFLLGVDLGGNPTKNHFRDFEAALSLARGVGLKISVHCGEVPCESNEKFADEAMQILQFRPDRLGHALFLPISVYKQLYQNPIPIECCPTSNTMTLELNFRAVDSSEGTAVNGNKHGNIIYGLQQHPQLSEWIKQSYPFSISTDDSGVFNTNSSLEFFRFMKSFQVSASVVGNIVIGSIGHIFDRDLSYNMGNEIHIQTFLKTKVTKRINELIHWMRTS